MDDLATAFGLGVFDQRLAACAVALQLLDAALRPPLEPGQYLSIRHTERLAQAGAVSSVGSRGDAYDNAVAETVNGLFKAELIHRRDRWRSLEQSYSLHAPMSATLLSFHRLAEADGGLPNVVVERHGSLGIDRVCSVAAQVGLGIVLAPAAHRRLTVRDYAGDSPMTLHAKRRLRLPASSMPRALRLEPRRGC